MKKKMTIEEISRALGCEVEVVKDHEKEKMTIGDLNIGDSFFDREGQEWIILDMYDDCKTAICLARHLVYGACTFSYKTNNFKESNVLDTLRTYFSYVYRNRIVGAQNFLTFRTDLTSDDNIDEYGGYVGEISLLTCEQYRKYARIIEKYPVKFRWWLATPTSERRSLNTMKVRSAYPQGDIVDVNASECCGVRPVFFLNTDTEVAKPVLADVLYWENEK